MYSLSIPRLLRFESIVHPSLQQAAVGHVCAGGGGALRLPGVAPHRRLHGLQHDGVRQQALPAGSTLPRRHPLQHQHLPVSAADKSRTTCETACFNCHSKSNSKTCTLVKRQIHHHTKVYASFAQAEWPKEVDEACIAASKRSSPQTVSRALDRQPSVAQRAVFGKDKRFN